MIFGLTAVALHLATSAFGKDELRRLNEGRRMNDLA
jgi:hypothetical protein